MKKFWYYLLCILSFGIYYYWKKREKALLDEAERLRLEAEKLRLAEREKERLLRVQNAIDFRTIYHKAEKVCYQYKTEVDRVSVNATYSADTILPKYYDILCNISISLQILEDMVSVTSEHTSQEKK